MTLRQPVPEFIRLITQSLQDNSFIKLSLGHYKGAVAELLNIHVRKTVVKKEEKLSFTYHYKTRDIVKNFSAAENIALLEDLLKEDFNAATLCTISGDHRLERNHGRVKLRKLPPSQSLPATLAHNREKNHLIPSGSKHYLHALGITDAAGKVRSGAQDKYRQINKYVEILSGLMKSLPPEKLLRIVDMGSGKGYLTFALYDYMASELGLQPALTGVEMRADMVALCNEVAQRCGFTGLNFVQGSIEHYDSADTPILIALHACDIATDQALAKGISGNAELIVVAPCCHKQIRGEMNAKAGNDMGFLLRHGIFLERQAEMITDAMRALILEYFGYSAKVFEFIGGEHTPKNVMIVATRTGKGLNPQALEKLQAAKAYFGISHHHLERMMALEPKTAA